MKYRFFKVSVSEPEPAQDTLNRFCAEQRVVSMDKEFVHDGDCSYWAFCIGYLDGQGGPIATARKGKIDYREILDEADFALFARLRSLRKTLAEQEGIPAYALFTNEQLAAMVRNRVASKAGLAEIDGVGAARVEKYGAAFLELLLGAAETDKKTATESKP